MDCPRTSLQYSSIGSNVKFPSEPDSEQVSSPTPRSRRLARELQMDADSSFRAGVEAIRNPASENARSATRETYAILRINRVPQVLRQSYREHEGL